MGTAGLENVLDVRRSALAGFDLLERQMRGRDPCWFAVVLLLSGREAVFAAALTGVLNEFSAQTPDGKADQGKPL
jgi:hypothetical protein